MGFIKNANIPMLGNDPNDLPRKIEVDAEGNLKTSFVGSLTNICNVLNVTTAGTRVQLPDIPCREITIIAKRSNTGYIYAGSNTVSATVYGVELGAKDSFTFQIANANQIYINASVSGEGISYVAI